MNNGRIVTPDGVVEGASVVIEDGRIAGVSNRAEGSGDVLDANGRYVLPGLVDLHSDAIEKQLCPRPGVEFPGELAFLETDRLFTASGITTGFHALSFMEQRSRTFERARLLCDVVVRLARKGTVRHELHLRCELPQEEAVVLVEELLKTSAARIVSLMDHTPGQGQFRDLEWFRRYWKNDGMDYQQISSAIAAARGTDKDVISGRVERVAHASRKSNATLASHDDDSPERVEAMVENGVCLSEFPINLAAAQRAKELGVSVCAGAPNVVRGRSSGGNLSATEAVKANLADALVSDYHPPSMLQAAFKLAKDRVVSLHEAVRLVSSGPAHAVGLSNRGEVREGALADLLVVDKKFGLPVVVYTIVGDEVVLSSEKAGYTSKAAATGVF